MWMGLYTMVSLLVFKTSQPGKLFVLLQNLKVIFQPMGGKRTPLAAYKKRWKHYERPQKLFQPSTFVVLLSSLCLLLFLFPNLHSINKLHRNVEYSLSLMVSTKCQWPECQYKSTHRKWIHTNSVAGGSLYRSVPSNSNLSDCSAVSYNHHTHTHRKRERTGITHGVANYRV